ncbi:MAG: hypothetical protein LBK83_16720 [Treponema sp.]|jgi:hypothetical protein|nr:hypothetical protein [Treponema sp.]
MKKPVFPRIFALLFLYAGIFVFLVLIQFAKQGSFTRRIGGMVVSGRYRTTEENNGAGIRGYLPLEGEAGVFFGGLEFRLNGDENGGLCLVDSEGVKTNVFPESLEISGETAVFSLPGGVQLLFSTHYVSGRVELQIHSSFAEGIEALELPFRPLRTSRVRDNGNGEINIGVDGVIYAFARSVRGEESGILVLTEGGLDVSYGPVPEQQSFSPKNFIISRAETRRLYDTEIARWRDQNFSLLTRTITSRGDEDSVVAYAGEALRRGSYKAAVSAIPASFITGSRYSYESSVYLGRMDLAFRSFINLEREKISRLSRLINEKSLDILKEPHVFEFLATRAYLNFMDDGRELIRSVDPATLSLESTAGILEGDLDLSAQYNSGENPFERLADQACFVISENIRRLQNDLILVVRGGQVDTEFNIRLGKALAAWAEGKGQEEWAGVGRSMVLSALSLTDETGDIPAEFSLSDDEILVPGDTKISAPRIYRILATRSPEFSDYYPRAAGIGARVNGIWAWTAAQSLSASMDGTVIDIAVTFPMGETHYMMIRGIKPFTKIQLYNIDYRTDPQFERYDSSGWVYQAQDQVLVLKMKHRTAVEHIRIFY